MDKSLSTLSVQLSNNFMDTIFKSFIYDLSRAYDFGRDLSGRKIG